MYMIIPYYKGALFDYTNVITLVVYATNNKFYNMAKNPAKNPRQKPHKNLWQKPAKNPMQKLPKNLTKIHGKNLFWFRRIFQSINKRLTKKS